MENRYSINAPALNDTDAISNDAQPLLLDEEAGIKHISSEIVIKKKKEK